VRRRALALGAVAIVALSLAGFGVSGFRRVSRLTQEMQSLERELAALRAQSETLARAIECLRSDPLCIEKSAREDLGMAREGEIILKFPSERSR
jgi:cell division protein FtsB